MNATEHNELNAHDAEWQRYAVRLARLRIPFVVVEFNRVLDEPFCQAIKDRYDFDAKLDCGSGRVYFIPKDLHPDTMGSR